MRRAKRPGSSGPRRSEHSQAPTPAQLSFEEALARGLERWEQGETPAIAVAPFPDYDLLPYLELAELLRVKGVGTLSTGWVERSLRRALARMRLSPEVAEAAARDPLVTVIARRER